MPDGDHVVDLGRCQRGLHPIEEDDLDAVDLGVLSQTEGRDRGATGQVAAAGLDRRYLPGLSGRHCDFSGRGGMEWKHRDLNQVFVLLESLRRI